MANTTSDVALVTGASGLMGRALVQELRDAAGTTTVAVSSQDADLTKFEQTLEMMERHRPTIVYHLAARVTGIMGNMRAQGQAYLDNVRMNTNVIEAARIAGVRKIVAMGSAAVYSDMVRLPMVEEEVWIGPPHGSEAGYAHAKRGMLAQLEAYRDQYGMEFAFCISTNLFGPHDKFDEECGHVLPSLISKFHRAVQEDQPVTIWGTGKPERDFLYVKDAAAAMRLIGRSFSGPINLATGQAISIANVAGLLKEISGLRHELQWDRTKPDGQKMRSYDIGKLQNLGFQPGSSLKQALRETFEWYAAHCDTARR
ncbi:GDP-L-fucose synthase [Roseomonas aerophila]|uniref:GDP-L-fucose synthase n=1 Tax=Teichococcus aerophilus TaxID=1224513 RepID=A0ABR7RPI5_9PROT|nr:GDP-L-fucose synthase [Pseudoroseomonas aerophila]MBC9208484.1 GDP-L-fucose synthase [Pseudoroseomonas aerophila]